MASLFVAFIVFATVCVVPRWLRERALRLAHIRATAEWLRENVYLPRIERALEPSEGFWLAVAAMAPNRKLTRPNEART